MQSTYVQEVTEKIITERIALLSEIIRTGNEESAVSAAIHLGSIGTNLSDQATLELIEKTPDGDLRDVLAGTLMVHSPNRETLKAKLQELFTDDEGFDAGFETLSQIDPRLLAAPPLWQQVAEALEANFLQRFRDKESETRMGIWYAD